MKTTKHSGHGKSSRSDCSQLPASAVVTFARQMMIQQQDQTIHSIAGTLSTIAQQAGLMGTEIVEHNECAASFMFRFAGSCVAGCWVISTVESIGQTANCQMQCVGCENSFEKPKVSSPATCQSLKC